jgi:hypothetical protein
VPSTWAAKFQSQEHFDVEAPVRSCGRGPGHRRIYRGRSDERRPALEQCGGQCSKGRPQHPMLQHGRYCTGCRCKRMALVLRGSQGCVWLDRVGPSPRDALTKGTGSWTSWPPRVSLHRAVISTRNSSEERRTVSYWPPRPSGARLCVRKRASACLLPLPQRRGDDQR